MNQLPHSETWQQQEHAVAETNVAANLYKMKQQLGYMNAGDASIASQLITLQTTLSNTIYWAARMQALE